MQNRHPRPRARWFALVSAPALALALLTPAPAAAAPDKVLILDTTASGHASSQEASAAAALGFDVEVATAAQWAAKSAVDFASYRALILGDPYCSSSLTSVSGALNTRSVWGPEIDGNVIINGTDPVFHASQGGSAMTQKGIAFATDVPGKTGMYISLSCYYHGAPLNTPVPLLDPFGAFTARGVGCFNDVHIVATHPALFGMTDASLSNWSCSVHEAFDSWPQSGPNAFTVLAIAEGIGGSYTAPDGSVGTPYILARGEGLSAGNIALAPPTSSGPVGSTHTVTATVSSAGSPLTGSLITFKVVSGPHDGTTATASSDSTGQATFSYAGTAAGTDSIVASFTDELGNEQTSNTVTQEWTAPANSPPTGGAGGPYAGTEGSPIALDGTAADTDGDALTYSWSHSPGTLDPGATCAFADPDALDTTFTCTDDGSLEVSLSVSDGVNPPVVSSAVVGIANAVPTVDITAPVDGSVVPVGTAVDLTGAVGDPGSNDLGDTACAVDWDSGAGSVVATSSPGSCTASNTYTAAGVYTVAVAVDDQDGGTASDTVMVVVYDPSAGFVTGGGWIESPAGAYAADPTSSGRANFGFVSKYQKGATTPTGQTEFQYRAGGFEFHSSAYEWLVVAGSRAQYKGTGAVNGVSGYGFLLTATDGHLSGGGGVDQLRMKVWDTSTGEVVYDNQRGQDDDAAASDAIEGGSIVIHAKK